MIIRRFGSRVHSVEPDFSAVALNEINFRRDHAWSVDAAAFDAAYAQVDAHGLTATGDGDVQTDVETAVLQTLLADLRALEAAAPDGDMLMVLSEAGRDYPRLHSTQRTIVVGYENRLHFTHQVSPPLLIGVFRLRDGAETPANLQDD